MISLPVRIIVAASLVVWGTTNVAAQPDKGSVRVEVTDASGGRLPGVAVVATGTDGRILNAVTDRTGGSVFPAVKAGPVMLRFRLEGFTGVLVGVTVQPGVETQVAQRLEVAPIAETVVVQAPAPVEPAVVRPLPPPPAPTPPRGPLVRPVPPHDRDSVCGPAKPGVATESLGT
ncbi:MAG: carboxypeptidase-like regulatory domain-containing protein, partial [Vicinamibacterales bacterium]